MVKEKTLNEALGELEKTKKNFWNNHERRMNELNELLGKAESNLDSQDSEFDEKMAQINKDLDDLLE